MLAGAARIPLSFRADATRVFLRAPRADDADELFAVQHASWEFNKAFMPAPEPGDPAVLVRDRIQNDRVQWADDRSYRFVVCAREGGAIVGRVSLNNVIRGVLQSTDVGYWVSASHARRGITSEAVRLAIGIAFGPLGLHRVQAGIIPRNAPSLGLVRKIGFREEGLAKRFVKIAGEWEDHVIFALTVEEWENPYPRG